MAPSKTIIVALFLAFTLVANTLQPSEAIRAVQDAASADQEAPETTAAASSTNADASVAKPSAPSAWTGSPPPPSSTATKVSAGETVSPRPQVTDCLPPLMRLTPCMDYLTDTSVAAPPTTCCNGFRTLVNDAPICLCHGLNGDINKIMPAPMDFMRMMSLPATCRVALPLQTLAKCSVAPVPPLMIPAPAPGPVTAPSPAPSP
ncbi:hypothetical protein PR202_gb26215 [Eleusine coracana subsp. coracana]|uniref:Bifunctional inhibitor/plant lipid transfer protein/seed storage helical domain-containing protein n=1 Tax=Eleusine coracana subsp. coracana TaxID=191504 RepID=A0AAV5FR94_ELECO|nr:hypothetical protein PR202_gb26215 [Eleusine coracana subsp. coracana]